MVPVLSPKFEEQLKAISTLVLSEVNVKELELLKETEGILVKKIKPNFKTLGPRFGKMMKPIAEAVSGFGQAEISKMEANGQYAFTLNGTDILLTLDDVEIASEVV